MIDDSAAAGRPWVVNFDEQGPADVGVAPDTLDFWHDIVRQEALWPTLLAGGGGCEWYFGYANPHSDLDCENFRSRDNMWKLTARARGFLRDHVPFDDMEHADSLAGGNASRVLARRGEFCRPLGAPVRSSRSTGPAADSSRGRAATPPTSTAVCFPTTSRGVSDPRASSG